MPSVNRAQVAAEVREKLQGIPVDKLLPMPHAVGAEGDEQPEGAKPKEKRRLSVAEWEEYRQRCDGYYRKHPTYLPQFRRPAAPIAFAVWDLFQPYTKDYIRPDDWRPDLQLTEGEKLELRTVLHQAFLIVLDVFVAAGQYGQMITYNNVFDALASRFSDHHRQSPARTVRDMSEARVKACRRDLHLNGVPFNELWDFMVGKWSQDGGRNPLFMLESVKYVGLRATLRDSPDAYFILQSFLKTLEKDRGYRRSPPPGITILAAGEGPPRRHEVRAICADRPYNRVVLGKRSEKVLEIQENAQILLDVKAFRDDYEETRRRKNELTSQLQDTHGVDPTIPNIRRRGAKESDQQVWSKREEHLFYRSIERGLHRVREEDGPGVQEKAQGRVAADPEKWQGHLERYMKWHPKHRRIEPAFPRESSAGEVAEAAVATEVWRKEVRRLLDEFDRAARLVATFRHVYKETVEKRGDLPIRSGFYRIINRRYQPTHFWPTYVSKKGFVPEEEKFNPREEEALASYRKRWFKAPDPEGDGACDLVSLDVSSSQTQILATLFNVDWLQQLTMADPFNPEKTPFKLYLAETAWKKHRDLDDAFLLKDTPEPYEWPDDKLVALVKDLWMRVLYGSEAHTVVEEQRLDLETYGAGWTEYNAKRLLKSCREFHVLGEFLEACRRIARGAFRRDPYAGVTFTDPFDLETVRWNPVERYDVELSSEDHKVIASLPGRPLPGVRVIPGRALSRSEFVPAPANEQGEYPVDSLKLRNMVAPCLVHVLDACFSSLVMEKLAEREVPAFAGIHDCWMVPAKVLVDGAIQPGLSVLDGIIRDAAKEWYAGLGPVYDDLLRYLDRDPDFGHVIRRAKEKWEARVKEGYIPPFQVTHG